MNIIKSTHFNKAIIKLQQVLLENKTDIVRDSSIKRYEICYELAWKTVQELLKNEGMEACTSPKACFKQAFKLGLIENEELFAEMIENRNLTTHTYDENLANKIYNQLSGYEKVLENLVNNINIRNKT